MPSIRYSIGQECSRCKKTIGEKCCWIKDCGFDLEEAASKQVLTEENKRDINIILEYLMEDKYIHYQESGEPEDHIYKVLLRLKDMFR